MAKLKDITIKPGTTPTITAVVDEAIQDAIVYLTISFGDYHITKSNYHDNGELVLDPVYNSDDEQIGTEVTAQYSQTETLCMRPGSAKIEAGWVFEDGSADKTNIGRLTITNTTIREVMRYVEHTSE